MGVAALITAALLTRIYDMIFGPAVTGVAKVARAGFFVGVWAAVSTGVGMHGLAGGVRGICASVKGVRNRIIP